MQTRYHDKGGTDISTAKTTNEALALIDCNFSASFGPILDKNGLPILEHDSNGNVVIDKKTKQPKIKIKGVYNDDDLLGIVGSKYAITDHTLAMSIADVMRGDSDIEFVRGWNFDRGTIAMIQVKFPETILIAGEPITPYGIIRNPHDGSGSSQFILTPERMFCSNQMRGIVKRATDILRVRHTRSNEERIKEAGRILEVSYKYFYEQFPLTANELLATPWKGAQIDDLVNHLLPKIETKDGEEASKRAVTMRDNEREKLYTAFAAPDLANIDGTGWAAVNAVADYSDHYRNSRDGDPQSNAYNFIRAFEDSTFKEKAVEYVLARR